MGTTRRGLVSDESPCYDSGSISFQKIAVYAEQVGFFFFLLFSFFSSLQNLFYIIKLNIFPFLSTF